MPSNRFIPSKRTVYLSFSVLLFVLLSDVAYCLLALQYPSVFIPQSDAACAACRLFPLPLFVFYLLGAGAGLLVGKHWWRIIYIDDRRHKHYKLEW